MTKAKIRRGTHSDADFLAWAMLTASRAHLQRGPWDLIIGGDEAECLEYLKRLAMAEPRSMCHHDSFLVAEIDGSPAAALCGFKPSEEAWRVVGQAMANVQRELGWTEKDVAMSNQRVAPIGACFPTDAGADWCIDFVATLPKYRRQGLVDALLRAAIQQGVERGHSLAQILIFAGNDAAQAAYEKAGFVVHDECGSPEFQAAIGAPGFRRLMRKL
jgi:ribosomal protein S18 acetylase RimI-like enzyme